jgi:hypothetical protein
MHKSNFIYAHNESAAFPVPIFMKLTTTRQHCVSFSYTVQMNSKCGKYGWYSFSPLGKVWFLLCLVPQNSPSIKVCGHLLYWILSKVDGKYRKHGHNVIYCYIKVPLFTLLYRTKFTVARLHCTEFHADWLRNVKSMGRILCVPLEKVWLSLSQFSWNLHMDVNSS